MPVTNQMDGASIIPDFLEEDVAKSPLNDVNCQKLSAMESDGASEEELENPPPPR